MSLPKAYPSGYVSGIYPSGNATDVPISGAISLAFGYILDPSCDNDTESADSPIRLYQDVNQTTYGITLVSGQWSQDSQSSGLVVYVIPDQNLEYSTWYRVHIDAEKAIDNTSYQYYPVRASGGALAPLDFDLRFLTESGPQPTGSTSTTVSVESCTPEYGEIDVFPTGITIYFDHVISGNITDWSTYVSISGKSIFGGRNTKATYTASGTYTLGLWEASISSGVWSGGSYIQLSSGSWPADLNFFVKISSTLLFISGNWSGYLHEFTTYYDPYYCSPDMVRMDGGGYFDGFSDEVISTFIVRESQHVNSLMSEIDTTEISLLPRYVSLVVAQRMAKSIEMTAKMQSIAPVVGGYPGALKQLGTLQLYGTSLGDLLKASKNGSLTSSIDDEIEELRHRLWRLIPATAIKAEYDLRRPITDWTWRRWDEATLDDILRERMVEYWSTTNEF